MQSRSDRRLDKLGRTTKLLCTDTTRDDYKRLPAEEASNAERARGLQRHFLELDIAVGVGQGAAEVEKLLQRRWWLKGTLPADHEIINHLTSAPLSPRRRSRRCCCCV